MYSNISVVLYNFTIKPLFYRVLKVNKLLLHIE